MINASFEGTLHLSSLNLRLPIQRSYYQWRQQQDHRGRPNSKVRFGSLLIEVLANQEQLSELSEAASDPYVVLDGHAAYQRTDGQGTFITVWFREASLHRFTEYFDATGTNGTEPSWVVQFALAPQEMGRDSGAAGEFVMPAPGTHGVPIAIAHAAKYVGERALEPGSDDSVSPLNSLAAGLFPGRQRYGNCGVQACQQIIRQATGVNFPEKEILSFALEGGFAVKSPNPAWHGETNALSRQALLKAKGIASSIIDEPTHEQLATALREKKGIIAGLNADVLWGKVPPQAGGHAVLITHGDFNEQGELTHVYVNDTGTSNPDFQRGRQIPTADIMRAFAKHKNKAGDNVSTLNVTDNPIWD
ncbi:type VI secretion system tube protein TssD [Hymenobacter norwichensis]|uniref:type VI secretion system tube protein TssD n=1 Tax=Hymenobacter norwichensis TaxID=223903 RepID=UPI0003B48701|nr:type VI secretion system tube protein TssD [Hymenobacter norwichensis]